MEALKENPTRDVTTVKVDLRLSALKPLHCQCHESGVQIFRIFKRERGDIEWMERSRGSGIPSANTREV